MIPATGIQSLAREIVQYIAELLPTSSAAALALANKSFLFVLGRQYFNKVRGEHRHEDELRNLLILIERDVPRHYACLDYLRLHAFDYVHDPPIHWIGTAYCGLYPVQRHG